MEGSYLDKYVKTALMNKVFFLFGFISLLNTWSCYQYGTNPPVLIIAKDSNFGTYTSEILKNEGYNEFVTDSFASGKITSPYLKQFDVIVLAENRVDSRSKKMLEKYVRNGGNLIAFRPDTVISELFGLTPKGGYISEGYIAIDTTTHPGKGITSEMLQFHGMADKYFISGAKSIAHIQENESSPERYPGVVSASYGEGHTIAFLYNLPKSIVYTRQGNPLSAGLEKDGIPGIRAMDLFTDGWVDTSKNILNQADQQMALLSNCIQYLSKYSKPLPRFWYFPDELKCLVVLDNDGEYNNQSDFEQQFRDIDSMGAKMTLYILESEKVSKKWVNEWTAKGFEIASHPDDTKNAHNPTWNSMDSALAYKIARIETQYGIDVRTNVNHWFVWCGKDETGQPDFGAQTELEEKHGIEMDGNYAHYDINSTQGLNYLGPPGIKQGNYNGSGFAMKYVNGKGKTVDVYQRFNAVYDQQYMETKDPEGFFDCFRGIVDRSLNEQIYSVVSIKAHNSMYYFSKVPILKMLAYAKKKDIPVWTAQNLLHFLKMKDEASFTHLNWLGNQLSFYINSSLIQPNGLTFMLPVNYNNNVIKKIAVDSIEIQFEMNRVKGVDYAFGTVNPGGNHTVSVDYELEN